MSEFTGTYGGGFDAKKGRISVPAPFRAILSRLGAEEIILRKSRHQPCVEVWPKPDYMAEVNARTAGLSKLSAEYQTIMRKLVGRIHTLHPDSEGRVVMPKELSEQARFEAELQFAGRGGYFEIWAATAFAEAEALLDAEDEGGDV
ncbi:MAG: cell division/cell wall cluster transcriptional repressor MraZ [Acetobacteraceae bacterium]|nr:MAG: cell division/cell wall cluster transcriptional repressor MraZ [Acetobacteraceae bacterium]